MVKPAGKVLPRTEEALKGIDSWNKIPGPSDGAEEQVFFHENKADNNGWASAGVINRNINMGAYVKYSADTLPVLVQWKSPRSHDYTLGIEPSNTYIKGRKSERDNGTLPTIPGYGTIEYDIILGILDGEGDIESFEKAMNA